MKKILIMSTTFALLAFLFLGSTSCNKSNRKPADLIVGDYIGSGTDANENPFIGQIIRITKVSNKRVKVEPVGHSYITAFEVDVESIGSKVSSLDDTEGALAAQIDGESISLAITTVQEQTFGGSKQ